MGDKTTTTNLDYGSASPTRGIFASGEAPSRVNSIELITMMTVGNSTDFGDLTRVVSGAFGAGNEVTCLIAV